MVAGMLITGPSCLDTQAGDTKRYLLPRQLMRDFQTASGGTRGVPRTSADAGGSAHDSDDSEPRTQATTCISKSIFFDCRNSSSSVRKPYLRTASFTVMGVLTFSKS